MPPQAVLLPYKHWHLDKRVPLALILTIVIKTAGLLWWASSLSERVNSLERTREATAPQADRLTRVEVKLEGVQSGTDEIKRLIRASLNTKNRGGQPSRSRNGASGESTCAVVRLSPRSPRSPAPGR